MTLAPIDPTNEVAVTDYLTRARDWLSRAVDETGPEQIAAAKAEIATAAEATKQLGLSKEIQLDAQEMVRRAEYALGKAIRKGQAEGTVAKRGYQGAPSNGGNPAITHVPDLIGKNEWRGDDGISSLADATDDDFDEAIDEAKAEGNLSRANVARKAREKAGAAPKAKPQPRRKPYLEDLAGAISDLSRAAEKVAALMADDRLPQNAEEAAAQNRSDLIRVRDAVQGVIDRLA